MSKTKQTEKKVLPVDNLNIISLKDKPENCPGPFAVLCLIVHKLKQVGPAWLNIERIAGSNPSLRISFDV